MKKFELSPRLDSLQNSRAFSVFRAATRILSLPMLALILFCSFATFSPAQVSASLSGLITDQSGAAVSAANVTAKNVDTGVSRTALSDQSGRYQLFALPVGWYVVQVSKDGFAEGIRTGV